ncbi:MAG: hypothetical protein ACI93R_002253 [Flavobacteriales bacterium]
MGFWSPLVLCRDIDASFAAFGGAEGQSIAVSLGGLVDVATNIFDVYEVLRRLVSLLCCWQNAECRMQCNE